MSRRLVLIMCAVALSSVLAAAAGSGRALAQDAGMLVYVGTYTRGGSEGIYAFRFDDRTGALRPVGLAAVTSNPSFLVVHPNGRWLYAVNEDDAFKGEKSGAVSAFAIDRATGRLALLNQRSSRGAAPCHLAIDRTGRYLLVANYNGGNVSALPIGPDGRLGDATSLVQHTGSGPNVERQREPHAHAVVVDQSNRFVLAADLGIDKVLVYRFDAERGTLDGHGPRPLAQDTRAPGAAPSHEGGDNAVEGGSRAVSLQPGAGPRHVAFDPASRRLYAINELTSTITALAWDATRGALTALDTVTTLPSGFRGSSTTAEIAFHPSGRFLYGSNRGHDSIVAFRVDPTSGRLALVEHEPSGGRTPRNFALTPDGHWLVAANQDSNSLVVFRIDQQTGALERTGDPAAATLPVCVTFVAK